MNILLGLVVGGLSLGSVYGLVALGFVVVFKATGILNFAQGYLMMLGVYLSYFALSDLHLEVVLGVLLVLGLMFAIGFVSYFLVVRWVVGRSLMTGALITIALGSVIEAAILLTFGPTDFKGLKNLPSGSFHVGSSVISYIDLTVLGIVIIVAAGLGIFFKRSRLGQSMRATADDLIAAVGVGVSPNSVFLWTWCGAMVLAGFAGFLYGNYTPTISTEISALGLLAFPAAVIGGIRSLPGAIVGGLVVGVIQVVGTGYLGESWGDVLPYLGLGLILILRPNGILGKADVVRV